MVFSSLTFIFLFLPLTLILYYVIPKSRINLRNFILLLMSLLFYSWGEPKYIFLMVFSIIINYFLGILLSKNKNKKLFLIISILINIGLLVYFKYFDFLIETFNSVFNMKLNNLNIILPIGISFYTFQILSYVIDVYKGKVKAQKNIFKLATYVSLFPQLIAGPIVRYETIEKELSERHENIDIFSNGLRRFIVGLAKKIIIANNVALFADTIFNSSKISDFGSLTIWVALIAYGLQIYFDFSGYSDMAIGLGKMFGFNFLENFNYPYIATSITDFWRRWHISLSTWFRDYVYIPLGGNKKGKLIWIRNFFIVWILTGLWHGASWNFVLWGLYYALILLLEKIFFEEFLKKIPKIFRHLYSIIFILLGWLLFRIENISSIFEYLGIMFSFKKSDISLLFLNHQTLIPSIFYIIIGIILSTNLVKKFYQKLEKRNKKLLNILIDLVIFILLVVCVIYLTSSKYNPFIYYRF